MFSIKLNRGQNVRLVAAVSLYVVSRFNTSISNTVSIYRFYIAMSFRPFICIMVCRVYGGVISFLQCFISSRNHCFVVLSFS